MQLGVANKFRPCLARKGNRRQADLTRADSFPGEATRGRTGRCAGRNRNYPPLKANTPVMGCRQIADRVAIARRGAKSTDSFMGRAVDARLDGIRRALPDATRDESPANSFMGVSVSLKRATAGAWCINSRSKTLIPYKDQAERLLVGANPTLPTIIKSTGCAGDVKPVESSPPFPHTAPSPGNPLGQLDPTPLKRRELTKNTRQAGLNTYGPDRQTASIAAIPQLHALTA